MNITSLADAIVFMAMPETLKKYAASTLNLLRAFERRGTAALKDSVDYVSNTYAIVCPPSSIKLETIDNID